MLMGIIGTRSLNTVIPGIDEMAKRAEVRINEGLKAYDALQQIREAGSTTQVTQGVRDAFEYNGPDLGYALLLKRYVDDPRKATPEQIHKAAWDTVPQVAPLFWLFRVMAAIGMFLILLTITFFVLSARRRLDRHRWLLQLAVIAIPLPWIAAEAGWLVAEFGRQPWIIEGVLPTAVAVSNLGATTLFITLAGFCVLYTLLFVIEMKLMFKAIQKGPHDEHPPLVGDALRRGMPGSAQPFATGG
jgi:cytochrome d ubiquinol oxidase subunit I